MEKIWLKHYPENIPEHIDPNQYRSLIHLFEAVVTQYKKKPALYNLGTTITYEELDKKTRDFAAYLQGELKLKKGDRLAIMLPNCMQYFVAIFGALRAGLIVVNVNPLYTPREFAHQLKDSGAETIIVLANFMSTVEEALSQTHLKHIIVTEIGDMFSKAKSMVINFAVRRVKKLVPDFHLPQAKHFRDVLKQGRRLKLSAVEMGHHDIAFLQYTGGTTGVSKGAMLTHRNILANVEQAFAWMIHELDEGQEVAITALPMYHIFSLTVSCFMFMKIGVLNVLITNPRDLGSFIKDLSRHRFSIFIGVNTLFKALMRHKHFSSVDFSSLKIALGGGMAVHRSVALKWKEITGKPLLEAYGLTETSPAVCCTPLCSQAYSGSIGFPMPSTEIKVVDDDGNKVGIGIAGELCVRGPQVMLGYWNRPEETANVLTEDKWFHTGDIAIVDATGFVSIVDRKKDMIVVSGFNVYPSEVEAVISEHPDIAEVVVLGIPSEKTGEYIKAYIVKKNPNLDREEVIRFCRDHLTTYKIPKHVEFRDALPKSNVGKVLRRVLRDEELMKKSCLSRPCE